MSTNDEMLTAGLPFEPARGLLSARTRTIVATSIGNMLEWYDFTVYALFAGYIAENFFPGDGADVRLTKAFLFFGLGFVVRPLGAVLIGAYGDRAGRKAALTLTILLMAAGTGIIAICPGYASIGAAAPVLLLLGRVLQGFSAGGEVGGTTAYLLETGDPKERGRIASWLEASMGMANILGALAAFSVTSLLSSADVRAWGWRLPFIAGLAIAPVGLYLRRSLNETVEFQVEKARQARQPRRRAGPLFEVFSRHARTLATGFTVAVLWAVAVYVLMIFLPTYIQRPDTFNFTAKQAFGASLIGNVPFIGACVLFGAISDRIGRRLSLFISAALLLATVLPLFMWLQAHPTFATLLVVQSTLCILVASFVGVAPAALSEIFPTAVRSTGTSLVYNGAFTIFGGFAPMILTWAKQGSGGSILVPAWYVMAAAAVALVAIPLLGKRNA
jgi:MFS transporter, MHS family, proline/betaine transporter